MKSYYFISGLPRSGSTLLSAILNQNPKFYADIKSPIDLITENVIDIITCTENNTIVTENQRKHLMYGIFDSYYHHVKNPIVFDTSRVWTRKTNFIKALFPYTKILCPVRDIFLILNSFETLFSKNPFYTKTIIKHKEDNVFVRCDEMLNKIDGIVMNSWIALQEGYAVNPEMIYFIEYDDLCKEPEKTMKKIYEFLEIPYYTHNFKDLEYSNQNFDKYHNLKNFHTVRKKVEYNPPKCILPVEIIQKCKEMNMEFWKLI